jgi:hypothetical protein
MASIQLNWYEADDGDLPDACMCCGEPATIRKRRRFVSHPAWVYLLLPMGLLPYVIAAAILTEHIRCYTLFCPRHKNYWLVRNLKVWGAFLVILPLIIGGFVLVGSLNGQFSQATQDILVGSMCIVTVLLLLGWLITIPISQEMAIHPANATDYHVTLKRVSPAFVEAVRQHRANRKSQAQAEDYRSHFRPRRSSSRGEGDDEEFMERS